MGVYFKPFGDRFYLIYPLIEATEASSSESGRLFEQGVWRSRQYLLGETLYAICTGVVV
jgi:hypothetical protein